MSIHRFDNRRIAGLAADADWLSREQAIELLGVKAATLYTYVSRGWVERRASGRGRENVYARRDIERLCRRRDARSGHAPAAAQALRWGPPVLDTTISDVRNGTLSLRGRSVEELTEQLTSFEAWVAWLWKADSDRVANLVPESFAGVPKSYPNPAAPVLTDLARQMLTLQAGDRDEDQLGPAREHARGRAAIRLLVRVPPRTEAPLWVTAGEATEHAVARRVCARFGETREAAIATVDLALRMIAEHGLAASTFATRVTASTGAGLYASLAAGLCACDGPRHGGACRTLEQLSERLVDRAAAREHVRDRLRARQSVPGFGHPLYPDGDPRGAAVVAAAAALGGGRRFEALEAIRHEMAAAGYPMPSIDFGLATLTAALGWPVGAATWVFGVGRCAGWVAHVVEQRGSEAILRPRARFGG